MPRDDSMLTAFCPEDPLHAPHRRSGELYQ